MKRRKNKYIPPKTESSAKNDQFSFKKLIAILLVVNLLTTGVSFSKYVTSSGPASDFARVASFAVQADLPVDVSEAVIVKGSDNQSTEYTIVIHNRSEVAVSCSGVLTYAYNEDGVAGRINVSCKLGDNAQTTPVSLNKPTTFNNIGTIPPGVDSELKLIFQTKNHLDEDYKNEFLYGLELALTVNQVD